MSDDTEPVIHTIGSMDKHDTRKLGHDIPRSKEDVPSGVDNKFHNSRDRAEKFSGDTVVGPETQGDSAGAHSLSEPGVVGKVQTVGTAAMADRDARASSVTESKHGR